MVKSFMCKQSSLAAVMTLHEGSASNTSSLFMLVLYLLILCFFLAFLYIRKSKTYKSAKIVKKLCIGKSQEQAKIIAYFLRVGCGAKTISDEAYINMVDNEKNKYGSSEYALNKLGLDGGQVKEVKPICFQGFAYEDAYVKKTVSGKWVSSRYEITWIFFSDSQVHVYSCRFDMDKDNKRETTSEYFYRDVNSFSTISEMEKGQNDITVPTEKFGMYGAGINFECALTDDNAAQTINGMRQKLREKKEQL